MKKILIALAFLLPALSQAGEREYIWKESSMPDSQEGQIAAMTDEVAAEGFDRSKNRIAYLDWYDAPSGGVTTRSCMILISGGGYYNCCDIALVQRWADALTAEGVQCVKFVYRTPRPVGLPIYQTAWEDGQRAVRMVRSEAEKRGFDPERIGIIGMSAGSHLGLLLATSSQTPAYSRTDEIDDIPCHINWAVLNAPAYITTDARGGNYARRQGYGADVRLEDCFKFDGKTCPMSLHHGDLDPFSPNGSTLVYRELRKRNIPAELHLYPDKGHSAPGMERGIEFLRQMGFLGPLAPEESFMDRYPDDSARAIYFKEAIWPEGKMPDRQERQCEPYLEWHIPAVLKTTAVQIIYSGGGYSKNDPDGAGVAPVRRYLNEKGMAVVTMKYRTPRPTRESGLAKHTTAWQDLQRAIRIVRSEAASRGLDPDRIGIMGGSAGGHLTLMGTTSSRHMSYLPIDDIDKLPCKVQWGIALYPAYVLTDGADKPNSNKGNGDGDIIVQDFSFDLDTAPMLFIHGDKDGYSPMASVKVWEKMRSMGIQCELHTLATIPHAFVKVASPGTGRYTYLDRIGDYLVSRNILPQE